MKEVVPFDEMLEKRVKEEFGDEATPEFINMLRLGKAAYEHGYNGFISQEKVMEWAGKMYDGGQKQNRVSLGKVHGMILTNSSDVMNTGAYLELFGTRDGFLSE